MKRILTILILILPIIGYGQNTSELYKKYYEAVEKGKMKKANRELLKISKVETNRYIHYMTLGNFHGDQKNLDSAVYYLGTALNYNSNQPISSNQEGYYKLRDSLRKQSIVTFDWIIETSPRSEYYYDRSVYKSQINDYEAALLDIRKAIEMEPNDAQNFYNQGIIFSNLNELDSASASYDRCTEIDPKYGAAYLNKGFVLIKMESFKLAIKEFKKALDLIEGAKSYSFTLNNIGYCYIQLSNFEKAQYFIEESIEMNPVNSYAYRNLALLNIGLEKKSAACKSIDKAIELGFVQDYGDEILELKKTNCD